MSRDGGDRPLWVDFSIVQGGRELGGGPDRRRGIRHGGWVAVHRGLLAAGASIYLPVWPGSGAVRREGGLGAPRDSGLETLTV